LWTVDFETAKSYLFYLMEARGGKKPDTAKTCPPIVQQMCDGKARGLCNQCLEVF
jgi:hypothetical protein